MKIFVTGARGFLASYLLPTLQQQGHQLTSFSGDILDAKAVQSQMQGHEVVFHLAAKITDRRAEWSLLHKVNVEGTGVVAQAAVSSKIKKFIHVSSSVAVGASWDRQILDENSLDPIADLPMMNYHSKKQGEQIVLALAKAGALDAVVVNPGLIFGAGDASKTIRRHFLKMVKTGAPFYGSGGLNVVGVQEVVDGMIQAMHRGRSGERYLLTGENLTSFEFCTMVAEASQQRGPRYKVPDPLFRSLAAVAKVLPLPGPLNVESLTIPLLYHWYSHAKAKQEIGFQPKSAVDAISSSVNWILKNT